MGDPAPSLTVGRYEISTEIAAGGMATVHLGRLAGAAGFGRVVAIKRLHRHLARDPEFAEMFIAEANLASRIRHPNVVPTLDVVSTEDELFVVLDYVEGESLSQLTRAAKKADKRLPLAVVSSALIGVLQGLHAAHTAVSADGTPLKIIHRDVSPQNVLVGVDGVARVLDFGVAKAMGLTQTTRAGTVKGKIPYMPPEQLRGDPLDPRADLYAVGLMLWECFAGKRYFTGDDEFQVAARVQKGVQEPPSSLNSDVPPELDELVMKACHREPDQRFEDALAMAKALRDACVPAIPSEVGQIVREFATDSLGKRARLVADLESSSRPFRLPLPEPSELPTRASKPDAAAVDADELPTRATDEPETLLSPARGSHQTSAMAPTAASPMRSSMMLVIIGVSVGVIIAALVLLLSLSLRSDPVQSLARLKMPVVPPLPTTSSSATPVPSASTAVVPPAESKKPPPRPPPRTVRPPSPPKNCNPPYTVRPDGTKKFKPECF